MDSSYLIAGIAVAAIAIAFAWYEIRQYKNEIQRHKDAAVKYRGFVAKQKGELVSAVVERLLLNDATFPGVDVAIYSKVSDLYDSPELMDRELPIMARDRFDMYWTRADFHDDELFVLWLEGIIEHGK